MDPGILIQHSVCPQCSDGLRPVLKDGVVVHYIHTQCISCKYGQGESTNEIKAKLLLQHYFKSEVRKTIMVTHLETVHIHVIPAYDEVKIDQPCNLDKKMSLVLSLAGKVRLNINLTQSRIFGRNFSLNAKHVVSNLLDKGALPSFLCNCLRCHDLYADMPMLEYCDDVPDMVDEPLAKKYLNVEATLLPPIVAKPDLTKLQDLAVKLKAYTTVDPYSSPALKVKDIAQTGQYKPIRTTWSPNHNSSGYAEWLAYGSYCLRCHTQVNITEPNTFCNTCLHTIRFQELTATEVRVDAEKPLIMQYAEKLSWLAKLPVQEQSHESCYFCQKKTEGLLWTDTLHCCCVGCLETQCLIDGLI